MMNLRRHRYLWLTGLAVGAFALPAGAALYAQNRQAPESILPPGFENPAPAPRPTPAPPASPRTPAARPNTPAPTPAPSRPPVIEPGPPPVNPGAPEPQPQTQPDDPLVLPAAPSDTVSLPAQPQTTDEPVTDTADDFATAPSAFDLPPSSRRSLTNVGIIGPERGGLDPSSFTRTNGKYMAALLRNTKGHMVSRWGSILLRRVLASKTDTPPGINGADWVAARAAMLLRMGEADNARLLVQNVDTPLYTPYLYETAMLAYLANADASGLCPIVAGGAQALSDIRWDMSQAVCFALSGEQSAAVSRIDRLNRQRKAPTIDLLLAEKAVGAGVNGRRAVTIKWDGVSRLTPWRFGMALATGVEPPDALFDEANKTYLAWRASAPMAALGNRIAAADTAAAMGVLSNAALVDLYGAAYDNDESSDDIRARASLLRGAYALADIDKRLDRMRSLWGQSDAGDAHYASLVLTARAAARIPVSADYAGDSDTLIASMLTAGLDRNAIRWARIARTGSDGWAMLVTATPALTRPVGYGALSGYLENDTSAASRKSAFLLAGLAGLGRVSDDDRNRFANELGINLAGNSRWTRAIDGAARTGNTGLVSVLVAVGMQGDDWAAMSATHLYHIVRALDAVGLNAEARMIAAEAIARG